MSIRPVSVVLRRINDDSRQRVVAILLGWFRCVVEQVMLCCCARTNQMAHLNSVLAFAVIMLVVDSTCLVRLKTGSEQQFYDL